MPYHIDCRTRNWLRVWAVECWQLMEQCAHELGPE